MLIAEHIDNKGELRRTFLTVTDNGAELRIDDGPPTVLPVRAILLTLRKFGRALAPDLEPGDETLELGDGIRVRVLHYIATVDVEPKTYLVLEGDGEPLCALSGEVAAALRFLAQKSR